MATAPKKPAKDSSPKDVMIVEGVDEKVEGKVLIRTETRADGTIVTKKMCATRPQRAEGPGKITGTREQVIE